MSHYKISRKKRDSIPAASPRRYKIIQAYRQHLSPVKFHYNHKFNSLNFVDSKPRDI